MVFGLSNSFSSFQPKLHFKPAFLLKGYLEAPRPIEKQNIGSDLKYVNISPTGQFTFKSVDGYRAQIHSTEVVFAGDFLSVDPDGKHARGDIRGVIKTDNGEFLALYFKSIINMSPQMQAIMSGSDDAKTTTFADYVVVCEFKTPEKYSELQNRTYLAAAQFTVEYDEDDKMKPGVVYRISECIGEP